MTECRATHTRSEATRNAEYTFLRTLFTSRSCGKVLLGMLPLLLLSAHVSVVFLPPAAPYRAAFFGIYSAPLPRLHVSSLKSLHNPIENLINSVIQARSAPPYPSKHGATPRAAPRSSPFARTVVSKPFL